MLLVAYRLQIIGEPHRTSDRQPLRLASSCGTIYVCRLLRQRSSQEPNGWCPLLFESGPDPGGLTASEGDFLIEQEVPFLLPLAGDAGVLLNMLYFSKIDSKNPPD